jgi:hypothetical protein
MVHDRWVNATVEAESKHYRLSCLSLPSYTPAKTAQAEGGLPWTVTRWERVNRGEHPWYVVHSVKWIAEIMNAYFAWQGNYYALHILAARNELSHGYAIWMQGVLCNNVTCYNKVLITMKMPLLEVMTFIRHVLVCIRQAAFIFCWICSSQSSDFQQYDIRDINVLHPK